MKNKSKKLNIKTKVTKALDKDRTSFEPRPHRVWNILIVGFFVGVVISGLSGLYIFRFFDSVESKDSFSKKIKIDETLLEEVVHEFAEREREFNEYLNNRGSIIDPAE